MIVKSFYEGNARNFLWFNNVTWSSNGILICTKVISSSKK